MNYIGGRCIFTACHLPLASNSDSIQNGFLFLFAKTFFTCSSYLDEFSILPKNWLLANDKLFHWTSIWSCLPLSLCHPDKFLCGRKSCLIARINECANKSANKWIAIAANEYSKGDNCLIRQSKEKSCLSVYWHKRFTEENGISGPRR